MDKWTQWIIWGGEMPHLFEDVPPVPYPEGFEDE